MSIFHHSGTKYDVSKDEDEHHLLSPDHLNSTRQRWWQKFNEPIHNIVSFWLLGLLNNYCYVLMLSAAKQIEPDMTGLVLFADIFPTLLIKLTAPFWVHLLSYNLRVTLCGISALLSFLFVSFAPNEGLRLFGVVLASIGSGWGEVTFLAYSAYYDKVVVTAWSSGTGFAGIVGAGWYLLFTDFAHLSAKTTLEIAMIFPVLYICIYFLLLRAPRLGWAANVTRNSSIESKDTETHDPNDPERGSSYLLNSHKLDSRQSNNEDEIDASNPTNRMNHTLTSQLTLIERLKLVKPLLKYMIPLAIVYFAEYTINTGVNSELSFSSMSSDTFYVWASFIYQIGVFLSRSSGSVFPLKRLWTLPVLQVLTLVYFLIQGFTNAIRIPWLVLVLVFWEGLLGGACYVNAFRLISEEVEPRLKEFSLGVASVADSFGIVVASLVSIPIESGIKHYRNHHGLNFK